MFYFKFGPETRSIISQKHGHSLLGFFQRLLVSMLTRDLYLMYMTEPELWAKSQRNHGEGNKEIRLCADDDRVRE